MVILDEPLGITVDTEFQAHIHDETGSESMPVLPATVVSVEGCRISLRFLDASEDFGVDFASAKLSASDYLSHSRQLLENV